MRNIKAKTINEIIRQSSGNINSVNYLMKLLSISRETAYRRLRNINSFSVKEIIAIAKDLNISIDRLLDLKVNNNKLLINGFNFDREHVDIYSGLLQSNIEFMEKLLASTSTKITAIKNSLPFRLLPFKSLFKFDYCRYMYSAGKIPLTTRYSDIVIPPQINELYEQCVSRFSRLTNITCIIDNKLFSGIIEKIQYYYRLRFISAEDLQILQAELFKFLEGYECLLRSGKNSAGSDYVFYYSLFNIESDIVFYEYDNNSLLQIRIFPESPIVIKNDNLINAIQLKWIDTNIRNSLLITKTADIHQVEMLRSVYQQISDLKP